MNRREAGRRILGKVGKLTGGKKDGRKGRKMNRWEDGRRMVGKVGG